MLHQADLVILLLRPDLPSISASAAALRTVRQQLIEYGYGIDRLGLALVGKGPYKPAEVAKQLQAPLVLELPEDPRSAAALCFGGKVRRGWPLLKATARAVPQLRALVARTHPAPLTVPAEGEACVSADGRRTMALRSTAPGMAGRPTGQRRQWPRQPRDRHRAVERPWAGPITNVPLGQIGGGHASVGYPQQQTNFGPHGSHLPVPAPPGRAASGRQIDYEAVRTLRGQVSEGLMRWLRTQPDATEDEIQRERDRISTDLGRAYADRLRRSGTPITSDDEVLLRTPSAPTWSGSAGCSNC